MEFSQVAARLETRSHFFCGFRRACMKKIIELKHITKSFDGEPVLNNIDLDIYDNEFITLLGPSGCGKTTTAAAHRRL